MQKNIITKPVSPDYPIGFRKGIVAKVNEWDEQEADRAWQHDGIDAVQTVVKWSDIRPQADTWDYTWIDYVLGRAAVHDKQAVIVMETANGKTAEEPNTATPEWVLQQVQVVESYSDQHLGWPVYGDTGYGAALFETIERLGERYAEHPSLLWWRATGWGIGTTEPSFYGNLTPFIAEELEKDYGVKFVGRTPIMPDWYLSFCRSAINAWRGAFGDAADFTIRRAGDGVNATFNTLFAEAAMRNARKAGHAIGVTNLSTDKPTDHAAIVELAREVRRVGGRWVWNDTDDAPPGGITPTYVADLVLAALEAPMSGMVVGKTIRNNSRDPLTGIDALITARSKLV